jgi:cytochrome c biogenesis protein CcmG/thiol:disulfide interchange protein DsbE
MTDAPPTDAPSSGPSPPAGVGAGGGAAVFPDPAPPDEPVPPDEEAAVPGASPPPPAPRSARGRRRHTALVSAIVLGVVLAAFSAVLATRKSALDRQARSPLLGEQAPAIQGVPITGGPAFDLTGLQGRYVLVNFFASWCVPCQQEQPQLVRFDHEPGGHTAVVGVLFSDTPGPARAYLRDNGGDWPVLADPNGQIALNYGVRGPPESYLVNPDGIVLAKFIGPLTANALDNLIDRAQAAG